MSTRYEDDVVAWAREQAAHVRAGRVNRLDLEHIAEEIEDVGKSEQRELASRMAVLLSRLLKWQHQASRHSASGQRTIVEQRKAIDVVLRKTPSLRNSLTDKDWITGTWADAAAKAADETGLATFPEACPWSMAEVLRPDFIPRAD